MEKNVLSQEIYLGHKIEVCFDNNPTPPNEWGDGATKMIAYHREFCVNDKDYDHEELHNVDFYDSYYVFHLDIYIHSGIVLSFHSRGNIDWDTSTGWAYILVKRAKGTWTRSKAFEYARVELNTWNNYLSGQVFEYYIDDECGCGGYYSEKDCLDEAKSEVGAIIRNNLKEHIFHRKQEIKHRKPLDKRVAFAW